MSKIQQVLQEEFSVPSLKLLDKMLCLKRFKRLFQVGLLIYTHHNIRIKQILFYINIPIYKVIYLMSAIYVQLVIFFISNIVPLTFQLCPPNEIIIQLRLLNTIHEGGFHEIVTDFKTQSFIFQEFKKCIIIIIYVQVLRYINALTQQIFKIFMLAI